jgi:hypothetical protein
MPICLEVRSVKDVSMREAVVSVREGVLTGKLGRLSHFGGGKRELVKKTGVVLTVQRMA